MSQERPNKELTLEELVALARTEEATTASKIEGRTLQLVELFIQEVGVDHGSTAVHNLILYDVYVSWAKQDALTLDEFVKSFAYYFTKHKNSSNNIVFKLKKKYKGGKFNLKPDNLKKCREQYGRKKDQKIAEQVSGIGPEAESN